MPNLTDITISQWITIQWRFIIAHLLLLLCMSAVVGTMVLALAVLFQSCGGEL